MSFLDDISKSLADVGQKGKGMVDTAKLNSMISDEEKKIRKTYEAIGELYFSNFSDKCDPLFEGNISAIKESMAKIEEYRKNIVTIKGITQCPQCGAEIPIGSAFCSICGAHIEQAPAVDENTVICTACGAAVAAGSRFCTSCGKPMA